MRLDSALAVGTLLATLLVSDVVPAATTSYVANASGNSVSVIDATTSTVTGTIAVGTRPTGVAIAPDARRAYVTNDGSDSISVIDTSANAVIATIDVGDAPSGLVVTPDGGTLYVRIAGGLVAVVDTALGAVVDAITVGPPEPGFLGGGGGIAITPDGSRVYVTAGFLQVIDTASNAVVSSIVVGNSPTAVAVTPDGTRVLVSNNFGNGEFLFAGQLVFVDVATNAVLATKNFWTLPASIAIAADGSRAYVASVSFWANTGYGAAFLPDRTLAVIDLATDTEITRVVLANTPGGVAVTPDGARVHVAIPKNNAVAVIDTATNTVAATVAAGSGPNGIAITPEPLPACSDGVDNDGDGYVDAADPACAGHPGRRSERETACGFGLELLFVLAPLAWRLRRTPTGA